jgi:hypothetical protein
MNNTIFGQMPGLISKSRFEKQVKAYQTEHCANGLRSRAQFAAMLFSQIPGQHGLRGKASTDSGSKTRFTALIA